MTLVMVPRTLDTVSRVEVADVVCTACGKGLVFTTSAGLTPRQAARLDRAHSSWCVGRG